MGVGIGVGIGVGTWVGARVGTGVVVAVGPGIGLAIGERVGIGVGGGVDLGVGTVIGLAVGEGVGIAVDAMIGVGVRRTASVRGVWTLFFSVSLGPCLIMLNTITPINPITMMPPRTGNRDFQGLLPGGRRPVPPGAGTEYRLMAWAEHRRGRLGCVLAQQV